MILGIDPGETVGLAYMGWEGLDSYIQADVKAELRRSEELTHTAFVERLADWVNGDAYERENPYGRCYRESDVEAIVCEDFRLLQGKQIVQTGSKMIASQVIGMAQLYAHIIGVPFVTQSPQILRITEMHMHWPAHAPTSHMPDHLSAQLHLLHYAETQGISTATLRELNPAILKP
jgi:hypothetical protein